MSHSADVPAPTPMVLGYANRFSVQPGETIRFMVSCEQQRYRAELFRLVHGDEHAEGPGYRHVRVPSSADGAHAGRHQITAAGSYVRIPEVRGVDLGRGFTVQCWIWPTTPSKAGGQTIMATWSEAEQQGLALGLDDDARVRLELGCGADCVGITQMGGQVLLG